MIYPELIVKNFIYALRDLVGFADRQIIFQNYMSGEGVEPRGYDPAVNIMHVKLLISKSVLKAMSPASYLYKQPVSTVQSSANFVF